MFDRKGCMKEVSSPYQKHCHIQAVPQLNKENTHTYAALFNCCLPSVGYYMLGTLQLLSTTLGKQHQLSLLQDLVHNS